MIPHPGLVEEVEERSFTVLVSCSTSNRRRCGGGATIAIMDASAQGFSFLAILPKLPEARAYGISCSLPRKDSIWTRFPPLWVGNPVAALPGLKTLSIATAMTAAASSAEIYGKKVLKQVVETDSPRRPPHRKGVGLIDIMSVTGTTAHRRLP